LPPVWFNRQPKARYRPCNSWLGLEDDGVFRNKAARLRRHGHKPVEPENPYWLEKGLTFEDPDGWRVVLMHAAGTRRVRPVERLLFLAGSTPQGRRVAAGEVCLGVSVPEGWRLVPSGCIAARRPERLPYPWSPRNLCPR
jgi:hypothetical protein